VRLRKVSTRGGQRKGIFSTILVAGEKYKFGRWSLALTVLWEKAIGESYRCGGYLGDTNR